MESKRLRERKAIEQERYGVTLERREDGIIKSARMRRFEDAITKRAPRSVIRRRSK